MVHAIDSCRPSKYVYMTAEETQSFVKKILKVHVFSCVNVLCDDLLQEVKSKVVDLVDSDYHTEEQVNVIYPDTIILILTYFSPLVLMTIMKDSIPRNPIKFSLPLLIISSYVMCSQNDTSIVALKYKDMI